MISRSLVPRILALAPHSAGIRRRDSDYMVEKRDREASLWPQSGALGDVVSSATQDTI